MPKVVAKFWQDEGTWEFMSLEDEGTQMLLKDQDPTDERWPIADIPQELLDRYAAAMATVSALNREVADIVDSQTFHKGE